MARKRASMREGPLADLFRSTEESVGAEDVKVTQKKKRTTRVEVAVKDPEREALEQEVPTPPTVPEPAPEPVPEPTPDPVPPPTPDPSPTPETPAPDDGMVPAADPVVEEIERRETRSYKVV